MVISLPDRKLNGISGRTGKPERWPMKDWGRSSCLLCAVSLFLASAGCQALYPYRPAPVLVHDAETKKPIVGAEVRVSYPLTRPSQAPWDSVAVTGEDGVAQVRAAPYGQAGVRIDAAAQGYLSEDLSVPVETVQEMERAHWFEDTTRRPARFVVELYAEPGPKVELVVPHGFRGLIRAEFRIQENAPLAPGQRVFRFPVQPPGIVEVTGPPLLRRAYPPDYAARWADGSPVPQPQRDWDVGLRPFKTEANTYYFVLGTQTEFDNIRRSLETEQSVEAGQQGKAQPRSHGRRGGRRSNPDSDGAGSF
jgi:hypothetical protein